VRSVAMGSHWSGPNLTASRQGLQIAVSSLAIPRVGREEGVITVSPMRPMSPRLVSPPSLRVSRINQCQILRQHRIDQREDPSISRGDDERKGQQTVGAEPRLPPPLNARLNDGETRVIDPFLIFSDEDLSSD
jgi:hypothetical protein